MLKTDILKLLLVFALLTAPLLGQSGITRPPNVIYVANEGGTGTVQGKLVKLTGAPSTAIVAGIADTSGVVGICVNNCGTTGAATIQVWGQVSCIFDSATTAGNYIQIDTSTVGDCMDSGAGTPPAAGQSIGRVLSTNGGAGTYAINLFPSDIQAGPGAGTPTCATYTVTSANVAFLVAGTTADVALFTLPQFGKIVGTTIKHSVVFGDAGGAMTDVSVSVGDAVAPYTQFAAGSSIGEATPVADTTFYDTTSFKSLTMAAAGGAVSAHFISTGRNFGNGAATFLTGGTVNVWVCSARVQ